MNNIEQQLTKTFTDFVKIPSPTNYELEFSNYLKNELEKLGLTVSQDNRGNLFTRLQGPGEPILLNAHIDTVGELVKIEPVLKDGVFMSAGDTILGADNKASVAVIFEILRYFKNSESPQPIEVIFSVSEEAGLSGIDTFDFSQVTAKEGICIDASKPVGTMVLGSPFYIRQTFNIIGKPSDSSNPQNGQSVLPALSQFIQKTQEFQLEDTLFNIGIINGGKGLNILLSEIEISAEMRAFRKNDLEQASKTIQKMFKESCENNNCTGKFKEVQENFGYLFDQNDSYVKKVAAGLAKSVGEDRVGFVEKYWGVSDVNNINGKGIQMVNLGYGAEGAHTYDEKIALKSMVEIFEFLKNYLSN